MSLRETLAIRAFGLLKVPMMAFLSPSILELTDEKCVVKIPLTYRSRNHLKSMYFGALSVGADMAGGVIAMKVIRDSGERGKRVNLIFKDLHVDFLKRAEGHTHFTCEDGQAIRAAVEKAIETGERQSFPIQVIATVPSKLGTEPVAKFKLTLSLKKQQVKS